ncbi:MAG: Ribosomal RNA small subunit methyltransferase E [Chlamydiae bacterium]|nr:Ribosomal RNA small subunit methyltransferase E [Chlamydiota bacterium]
MPENRFFLDQPFEKDLTAKITGDELKHLRVMRREMGDTIELVNGRNQLAHAKITSLDKDAATLILSEITTNPPPKQQLILAQALLKPKNLDFVIEKGTELGATAFWLFPGQRSEKKSLSPTQIQRCRHLAISALKQCGRLDLPEIREMPPLADWVEFPPGELFFGNLNSKNIFTPPEGDSTLFVGPEKGFSQEEEDLLSKHAKGVRLHPYVLRAETAALCFLSLSSKLFS